MGVVFSLSQAFCQAQQLVRCNAPMPVHLRSLAGPGSDPVRFSITQDLGYSLACSGVMTFKKHNMPGPAEISLLQHFQCRSKFDHRRNLRISGTITHDLGLRIIVDSIERFVPDETALAGRAEIRMNPHLFLSLFSQATTCLFNQWEPADGQPGTTGRTLTCSFLTPLVVTFAAGFTREIPGYGDLAFGLTSGKFTWLRDKKVFGRMGVSRLFGVPSGHDHILEFGLTVHLRIEHEFGNRLQWNCDLLVFKDRVKTVDLSMRNLLALRIGKYLKISLQTRLNYDDDGQPGLTFENILSSGFSLLM